MIWFIEKARFLKAFRNVIRMPILTNTRIWIEVVHNLRVSIDNIKGNTQRAKLQCLGFHAILDKLIFYTQFFDKVEWFYCTHNYLLK